MSDLNYYKITGLSDTVQYGKGGGNIKFVSTNTQFTFTTEDESVITGINAANATLRDGISITSSTGTLAINGVQLGYDNSGSLQFVGSGAVIIPVGVNAARPSITKIGMLRINTESAPHLETWNGTTWVNVSTITPAGSDTQIQYNSSGALGASSRFTLAFNELQSSTTLKLGNPDSFSGPASSASIAYIDGADSIDSKQGTSVNLRGGNNSGTGAGGNAIVSGGYAIGPGTQAGNVVLVGGESSVGNHGHVLVYTDSDVGGLTERLKIAGGTGAWGLGGNNYGSSGQVLTSNGFNSPPSWTTVAGIAKQSFAFNSNQTINVVILPTDSTVLSVTLLINTPFNDAATTITVGDAAQPDRLFVAEDNLPTVSGSYTVYPNYSYGIATQLTLTITGTSTAGSGIVTLQYQ